MIATEKWKRFLSSRFITAVVLLLAVAGRIVQVNHFSSATGDRAYQILATKNLVAGHGISTYEVVASNLSAPHYVPLIKWPPGYSLLLSPFYALSGQDFLWGSLWLDIIAAISVLWFARRIMLLAGLPLYWANLYTIVTGFFMYGFSTVSSSDLIGAALFEIALYLTLLFIRADKKNYSSALLIAFILFSGGLVRYLSIPVAFVIPVYFIVFGWLSGKKIYLSRGAFMLLMIALFMAGLFIFQKLYGGSATYIAKSGKGLFPENLLRTDTFIFSSFINTEFLYVQLEHRFGLSFKSLIINSRLFHLFVFAGLLLATSWRLKNSSRHVISPAMHFMYIGGLCSLAVIGLLSWLSLTHAPIPMYPPVDWTFVEAARYYFIPSLFIQQLFFLACWRYWHTTKKGIAVFLVMLLGLLFMNTAHDIYFTVKTATAKKQEVIGSMKYHRNLLHRIIKENPGKNIVTSSVDELYIIYGALWENIPGFLDCDKLNGLRLSTEKETIVFVTLQEAELENFKDFISSPETTLAGQIETYYFYTVRANPHAP